MVENLALMLHKQVQQLAEIAQLVSIDAEVKNRGLRGDLRVELDLALLEYAQD